MRIVERRWPSVSGRALVVAAIAAAAAAYVGLSFARGGHERSAWILDSIVVAAFVGAFARLWWRARAMADAGRESHRVWQWFAGATGAIALGSIGQLAVDVLLPDPTGSGQIDRATVSIAVFGAAAVVAGPFVYQGLIHWNRHRGLVADPGDWLNGLSAVLTIVGAANLALSWSGSPLASVPWWLLQGSLLRIATVAVLLGTTFTIASLGGLQRDPRAWGLGVALAVVGVSETVFLASGMQGAIRWPVIGWMVAVLILALCTLVAPSTVPSRQATTQAEAIGALVVLLASAAVLVANVVYVAGLRDDDSFATAAYAARLPVICSALAVLGVTIRLGSLIGDLTHLALTRQQAMTDDLTGIANRRALVARLQVAVESDEPLTLLVLDLDRFKEVNDRYGHAAGDALLRLVATRFSTLVPPGGLLARLGGDEFAVLLPSGEHDAFQLAQSLTTLTASISEIDGRPVQIATSIGLARGDTGVTCEELLRRGDAAMYRSKATGGAVTRYDDKIDRVARERAARVAELRSALDPATPHLRAQFVVHYQPQVDLRTGDVAGVEALVRWQHPEHGLLPPADFIDLVEEYGLMSSLTTHVMWVAARQGARWQNAGRPMRVAVNLSTSLLDGSELLPLVDAVLAGTGIEPQSLVLEVTETTLMTDIAHAIQTAQGIAERGVGLSIDDYGTGYSSLAYLNDLPASELKIDRSFIVRVLTDVRTAAIIAGTVELAHQLGLRLIAEGVEDEGTLAALRLLGCDESQGYVHSRPQPIETLDPWLTDRPTAAIESQVSERVDVA